MQTAIVWFRRDLRLADNPALSAALKAARAIVAVYVHSPEEEGAAAPGAASRWWLHHSLKSLDASLRQRGSALIIRRGAATEVLAELAASTGAGAVYWNRRYEPAILARDTALKARLRELGLEAVSSNGSLLFEPWEVATGAGGPYRVYTPFWRQCQGRLESLAAPLPAPARIGTPSSPPASLGVEALGLLPTRPWGAGLARAFTPGEAAAQEALARFMAGPVDRYREQRDLPALPGTSRLSPHFHFGEASVRQALAATLSRGIDPARSGAAAAGQETFLKEIVWREFAYHLLYHFPHTVEQPLDRRFDALEWRQDPTLLSAWQRGMTGIPMVDAGMRELYATGWMHNRVRMLVASLLCKNLRIHWRAGAAWFHDTLVDADLAANTLGWQWSAGCGADAAPYYRIFSPVLQAERFDPERRYLRHWLPELAALGDAHIHWPHDAPAAALAAAKVRLGHDYPHPVVDLKTSRAAALDAYAAMRAAPGAESATPRVAN